jgi:hypothetical protein
MIEKKKTMELILGKLSQLLSKKEASHWKFLRVPGVPPRENNATTVQHRWVRRRKVICISGRRLDRGQRAGLEVTSAHTPATTQCLPLTDYHLSVSSCSL